MGTKRNYDRTFKERAVKLSQQRDNIKDLASELGVSPERIYKWRAEYAEHGESSFQGHGIERLSDEGKRVKELKRSSKTPSWSLANRTKRDAEAACRLCPARRF